MPRIKRKLDELARQAEALKKAQSAVRKLQAEADALEVGDDGLIEVERNGSTVRVDPLRAAMLLRMKAANKVREIAGEVAEHG